MKHLFCRFLAFNQPKMIRKQLGNTVACKYSRRFLYWYFHENEEKIPSIWNRHRKPATSDNTKLGLLLCAGACAQSHIYSITKSALYSFCIVAVGSVTLVDHSWLITVCALIFADNRALVSIFLNSTITWLVSSPCYKLQQILNFTLVTFAYFIACRWPFRPCNIRSDAVW